MVFTYAEIFSTEWTHSDNGMRFDCRAPIREKCGFLHGHNSRIWVAHRRRDCRLFWKNNQSCKTVVPGQPEGYIFIFFSVGMAETRDVALAFMRRHKRDAKIRRFEAVASRSVDNFINGYLLGCQSRCFSEELTVDMARQFRASADASCLGDKINSALRIEVCKQNDKCVREAEVFLSFEVVEY